jgi:type II secretory pathway component PulF
MTTISRNRADAHAVWIGVAKGLGILAGIALVGGIVFFCSFILPKIEAANLDDAGARPGATLRLLMQTTHFVIKYFWLILVAGLVLGFVSARNASSRRSEMPRD